MNATMLAMKIEHSRLRDQIAAAEELTPWLKELTVSPPRMERAQGSGFNRLRKDGAVLLSAKPGKDPSVDLSELAGERQPHIFIVQHDWAAAFRGAADFDGGPFRLPYDHCFFEFRLNGKRVCLLVTYTQAFKDTDEIAIVPLVETAACWLLPLAPIILRDGEWVAARKDGDDPAFVSIGKFLADQVKAICVSLEAKVARTETIRADDRLNASRVKRGKLPLPEHSVVYLNRERFASDGAGVTGIRRRLHFRRGHWRHYETHRTWINWTLVGDPDLGFIDKEYKL